MSLRQQLRHGLRRVPLADRVLCAARARQQEYAAAISLAQHTRRALAAGIRIATGDELSEAVRDRIRLRRDGLIPKQRGQLHIFLAYPLANWEAVLPRSLAAFGEVSVFEWRGLGFDDTRSDWLLRRDRMNAELLSAFYAAHSRRPVDAVVGYLSGYNTAPEVLREIAKTGAAVFNFCWDDKLGFPGPMRGGRFGSAAALAGAVDLNLTNAPDSVVKYAVHGGLAMFWPEAAHPEVHYPRADGFDYDVTFVGSCYGWRPRFIDRLRALDVEVVCFGKGWPNGSISSEEMIELYSRSRINLGFAAIGQSFELMCLKGRDFEVPMSGGLYMTQYNPELHLVYDVGNEVVTYRDVYDCALNIRRLLGDEARAARIRLAGRARALRDHTYDVRWATLFRTAGLLTDSG